LPAVMNVLVTADSWATGPTEVWGWLGEFIVQSSLNRRSA
jgi:hypothetical protein